MEEDLFINSKEYFSTLTCRNKIKLQPLTSKKCFVNKKPEKKIIFKKSTSSIKQLLKFQTIQKENDNDENSPSKLTFEQLYKKDADGMIQLYQTEPPIQMKLSLEYQNNSKLLPKKFKLNTSQDDLKLNNYFIGKNHAPIVGRLASQFKSLNFKNCNQSHDLIKNLQVAPQFLNLANNKQINKTTCSLLGQFLVSKKQNLKEINLEGVKMGNNSAIELVSHLNDNRSLKILNLSDNLLNDQFAEYFKEILISNENIEEIYLHWNQIKCQGATKILEGVTTRDFVKILDLSWNMIGKGIGIEKLCKCLNKQKKSIVHLDLSYNGFNMIQAQHFQKTLKNNKSLMGFHFEGHCGYIDMAGFLQIPKDYNDHIIPAIKPPHRIQAAQPISKQQTNSKYTDHCWICDNWQEVQFYWPYIECFDSITVHLQHEDFKPNEMQLINDYELNKLCPLGRINFYFIINGDKRLSNIYSVDYDLMMNYFDVTAEKPLLDEDFDALVEIEPRMDDEEKESSIEEQVPNKWSYNNSIFKDFIRDNDELINQALQFDLNNSKIGNIKHFDRELLKQHYVLLKDVFKYICAFSYQSNIPCVTLQGFVEFLTFINIKVQQAQLDIRYLEITKQESSFSLQIQQINPIIHTQIVNTKGLNRRQFLELLIKTFGKEFPDIIEQKIKTAMKGFESETWRCRRYFNQYTDKVFRTHWKILQYTYMKYCGSKVKSFSPFKGLFYEEYKQFLQDIQLQLNDRDQFLYFIQSQMTQPDEFMNDRYLSLTFVEFLEVIGRLSEKLNLVPILMKKKVIKGFQLNFQINHEYLPLCFKIESFIAYISESLFKKQLDKEKLLNYDKYFENVEEQLQWRKLSKKGEQIANKTKLNQYEGLFKHKINRAFNLNLLYDDGYHLFRNTDIKYYKLKTNDSLVSLSAIPEYDNSF